jgi:hypothetical protein
MKIRHLYIILAISLIVGLVIYIKYFFNSKSRTNNSLENYYYFDKDTSYVLKIINRKLDNEDVKTEIQNQHKAFQLGISPEIHDIFECDGKSYIVMDSLDKTLYQYFFTDTIPKEKK